MKDIFSRVTKRKVIDWYKTLKLYRHYRISQIFKRSSTPKEIVVMLDGRMIHGGLSDRFWGIVSTYKYCKENSIGFRIYFVSPYKLEEFLLPNRIQWHIEEAEISFCLPNYRPRYISMQYFDRDKMKMVAQKILNGCYSQLHLYTNMRTLKNNEFSNLFDELFKLNPRLQDKLDKLSRDMPEQYISVTFRFQQLLGDFKEGNFSIINELEERELLIHKCLNRVEYLIRENKLPVLVTSDSSTFIKRVSQIDGVLTIPGKVVHIDYGAEDEDYLVHEKSFLDLFMIARATAVYLAYSKPLYKSGFPMTAALIGRKNYTEISI